jgi:iron(III) transport system substrate-binding protein
MSAKWERWGGTVAGAVLAAAVIGALATAGASAGDQVVNLYSARHYQTDERLYDEFTEETGIEVNRVEGKGDVLMARLASEGRNSPADVFITVDAGNLWRAEEAGLFQPVASKVLTERVPANLRHPDGYWFGFSTRARVIVYNKDQIDPAEISTYEDLADPKWKGKVCIRSSGSIYNQSLLASMIANDGEDAAEAWAKGVVANFARDPQGGDTDQIKAVAAGECALALANSYYYARFMNSDDPDDQAVVEKTGVIFPNQDGRGTHVNISGGGVLAHAPHKEAAIKFLEYLASDSAQVYFANGNNEYPVAPSGAKNPALEKLGPFKVDPINVSAYGEYQPEAQRIFDRAGWR